MSDQATSTSTDRRQDLLKKVRNLIDTADSFESMGNTAAAGTYREKADQLMTIYAIEEFELSTAQKKTGLKPELREYEYGKMPHEISETMVQLFYSLAQHCRVKVGWYGYHMSKIVGYPQDLDYLDILFTGVRMHMSSHVRPRPSRELGYLESLAMLKESGMKWKDAYLDLLPIFPENFEGARVDGTDPYERAKNHFREMHPETPWAMSSSFQRNFVAVGDKVYSREIPRKIGVRFTGEYTKLCEDSGRKRIYSDPHVYLRSFVLGYSQEIQDRLVKMRRATNEATTGKEMVLKSIMDDLLEFYYQCFPERRPHPPECDCDVCHRCFDPKCKRPRCVDARKPAKRMRSAPEQRLSTEGFNRGRSVGATADLSGTSNTVGARKNKELG